MAAKTETFHFRLDPAEAKALRRAAERDSRKVASLLTLVTQEWLRREGHLAARPERRKVTVTGTLT